MNNADDASISQQDHRFGASGPGQHPDPKGDAHARFVSRVAHELRNPLAPIGYAVAVLRRAGHERGLRERQCDLIDRQLARLRDVLEELVDTGPWGRPSLARQRDVIDFRDVIEHAVARTAATLRTRGQSVAFAPVLQPVMVEGDKLELGDAVAYLLVNASRCGAEGEVIRLSLGQENRAAVVRVTSAGEESTPARLRQDLDHFLHVGLGLTLTRYVIEAHGGAVELDAQRDALRAELRLPALATAIPQDQPGGSRRVLVVEDHPDIASALAEVLSLAGHAVRTAGDAQAALTIAGDWHPEVVILDIGLPGTNGWALARKLRDRAETCAALLIATSGFACEEDRRRSAAAGIDRHLAKPVDPLALELLIRSGAPVGSSATKQRP